MQNRNNVMTRPTTIGLFAVLLVGAIACGGAVDPAEEPRPDSTSPAPEVRTVQLDGFEAPQLSEGVPPCRQFQTTKSLNPGVILAARTAALGDAREQALRTCGAAGLALFSAELDETSYYETVTSTCLNHRNEPADASTSVELYAVTVNATYRCEGAERDSRLTQVADPVGTDPIPNGPNRPYVEPSLGPIVLNCTGEGDPTCCQDVGCCMDRGGGEGYCTARFDIDEPHTPENRF